MKRLRKLAVPVAIVSLSLLAGCSGKPVKPSGLEPKTEVIPLVGTFQVHRYNLDNGLRLLVVEDHSSPTFAYQTWFKIGSRDEEVGRTGLAHLFEHMMFKETKNLPDGEFDRLLEGAGAEGENAFTSRDYTVYVQEMPKDKLDLVTRIEADRMVNLVVNEKNFKTELEVVQNERRFRNENSPDGLMYQELFGAAYTVHPYHWPVVGYQEDLNRMTAEDAMKFYRSYYSPNHATIMVVGDVEPDTVLHTVEKYYGSLPGQASPVHAVPAEPEQKAPRRKTLKLNIQVEKMLIGYHIPEIVNDDMAAIEVLQSVLTGGKSSRLHRALVETGIASSVDSSDLEDKDPTLFMFSANLQKKKKAAQAESVMLREIARLSKELVSDKELERAKNRIDFGFFESLNSNSEKAHFMGQYETVAGTFEYGLKSYQRIKAITAVDVQGVVRRYLDPKNRTVITGVPK